MKVLVDNLAVFAVENCLLEPLVSILSPQTVMNLPDETVEAVAAESEDVRDERSRVLSKLESLEGGLAELNHKRRLRLGGK